MNILSLVSQNLDIFYQIQTKCYGNSDTVFFYPIHRTKRGLAASKKFAWKTRSRRYYKHWLQGEAVTQILTNCRSRCSRIQYVRRSNLFDSRRQVTLATSLDWMKSKKAEANASAGLRRREIQARGRWIEGHLTRRPRLAKWRRPEQPRLQRHRLRGHDGTGQLHGKLIVARSQNRPAAAVIQGRWIGVRLERNGEIQKSKLEKERNPVWFLTYWPSYLCHIRKTTHDMRTWL
jgi:hypothetical protein